MLFDFQLLLTAVSVWCLVFGQEAEITPVIGRKGTKCYDRFNKPQVRKKAIFSKVIFVVINNVNVGIEIKQKFLERIPKLE